ncbi:MAG TPA: carbonic anhydrase [Actinomycetota bacterium]|nr:carbonic anhydrase [Actinomycetota bacterium]
MTATDDLTYNNARHAAQSGGTDLKAEPRLRTAVLTCMDARLDPYAILGLGIGDVHILRNAGGVVTEDVLRSLTVSQRLLGTVEVVVIQHTECGMLSVAEEELKLQIRQDAGVEPDFSIEAFSDLDSSVRKSVDLLRRSPFLPHRDGVRGFVYDIRTGLLREVL